MNEENQKLTQEEEFALGLLANADKLFDDVFAKLELDDDPGYSAMLRAMLRKQAANRIIVLIWKNLDKERIGALKDYLKQSVASERNLDPNSILMEFALLYPDLIEKVVKGLDEFFDQFVDIFRKVHKTE